MVPVTFSAGVSHIMKVYRICFLCISIQSLCYSHAFSQEKNYPLDSNMVQWNTYFKIRVLQENIIKTKLLMLRVNIGPRLYTWEKSRNITDSKAVMFTWLRFFNFSPLWVLQGDLSPSQRSIFCGSVVTGDVYAIHTSILGSEEAARDDLVTSQGLRPCVVKRYQ